MKTISLEDLTINEKQQFSCLFDNRAYLLCDKNLSFIWKDDDKFCGFVLLRQHDIDFRYKTSERLDINEKMRGCEIMQIYGITPQIEKDICKRIYNRVFIWCYKDIPKLMFDYYWSDSLYDQSDYFLNLLNCKKAKIHYSSEDIRNIIYNKIRD